MKLHATNESGAIVSDEPPISLPFRGNVQRDVTPQCVTSAIAVLESSSTYQIRPQLNAVGNPLADCEYHQIAEPFVGKVSDDRFRYYTGEVARAKPAFIHALRMKLVETQPTDEEVEHAEAILRRLTSHLRIIRDSAISDAVKAHHEYTCQMCSIPLETPDGRYAEGAHIWPLWRGGDDIRDNLLCLCPNHHVLFDKGSVYVDDDWVVRWASDNRTLQALDTKSRTIRPEFVRRHREIIAKV